MAGVTVDGISKSFGAVRAVDDVSWEVRPGEFVALLGPSGCGKTTLLRLLAGFERPDGGRLSIGGSLVAAADCHVPPERRGVGMVFQSYALWPHMTVEENVAFALRMRRVPAAERRRRVGEALAAVGMGEMARRRPAALSGGQRQRVALARCLAMDPAVVLFDEPLANLDPHLRESMQAEFRTFHARTSATMIYVTHDQSEALALAGRVAVMMDGKLRQIAAPQVLYSRPGSADVARFIGRGMVVPCVVLSVEGGGGSGEAWCRAELLGSTVRLRCPGSTKAGPAEACLRAEKLRVAESGDGIAGEVVGTTFQGASTVVEVKAMAQPRPLLRALADGSQMSCIGAHVGLAVDDGWIIGEGEAERAVSLDS